MLRYSLLRDRKAQVSDGITWIVATLIILFLIITSVYVSSLMGKSKVVEKQKIVLSDSDSVDWIEKKTEFAYEINSGNKQQIENWILENEINEE